MKTYYKDKDGNFNLVNEIEAIKVIKFEEGIWHVSKLLKGKEYTFIAKKIKELPDKMDLARFLPFRYKISKKIKSRLDEAEMNVDYGVDDKVKVGMIIKIIERVIGGKKNEKWKINYCN